MALDAGTAALGAMEVGQERRHSGGALLDRLLLRGPRAGYWPVMWLMKHYCRNRALSPSLQIAAVDHRFDLGAMDSDILERVVVERSEPANGLPALTPNCVAVDPTGRNSEATESERLNKVSAAFSHGSKSMTQSAREVVNRPRPGVSCAPDYGLLVALPLLRGELTKICVRLQHD
jgi:hypothetical protein